MVKPLRLLNQNKAAMPRSADTHKECCYVKDSSVVFL